MRIDALHQIFLIFCLCAVIGCASGNRAEPLGLPTETLACTAQAALEDPIFQASDTLPKEWWELFEDPQLTEFIQTALAQNPTLQKARAQILFAAYTANKVRATLFPTLTWGADVSRQKLSTTGVIPFGPTGTNAPVIDVPITSGVPIPEYFTLYETEVNLAYNFDFWQKNRNTLRAALGQMQANIAEEMDARLQLGISVAQTYFRLQTNYQRQEIAQALINNRTQYSHLIQQRIHANIDNALSLQNAEANRIDAMQGLLAIQNNIAVDKHQLQAYLANGFNEEIADTGIEKNPLPPVPLPRDLPVHLLGRRPDITAQLWLIESARKQIDVAKAGFYPDFNLMGFFGYQTIHFREWFKWPSSYFDIDPAFTLPIFDGGRLIANLRTSEVNYDLAIFDYNNLVLNAVKEVLNGIDVLRNNQRQLLELRQKVGFQQELYRLTSLRMTHHLYSSLDTLASEANLLYARDQETIVLGDALQAILALIKALGGGYDVDHCNEGSL